VKVQTIKHTQLKKWRYSVPLTTHPKEFLLAKGLPTLAFAGDAFGGRGRIEGAFVSGIMVGNAMAEALS
jgi:predicted NAD/FAD-dependent oxidoreductase